MKKLLLSLVIVASVGLSYAGCAANGTSNCPCPATNALGECPEDPQIINACGSAFTISQATMEVTNNGRCCGFFACSGFNPCYAGAKCYGAEDLDCDGDDDMTCCSIENNVFFAFQPGESCQYNISITALNCIGGQGGSCAQYQAYNVKGGMLPTGNIVSSPSSNGCFLNTVSFSTVVTASNWFYLMIDGNDGSDCDMSITITPQLSGPNACTGCVLLSKEDALSNLRAECKNDESVVVEWNNLNEQEINYVLKKSYTGRDFYEISNITSSSLTNKYVDNDIDPVGHKEVYYQLWKRVGNDESLASMTVSSIKTKKVVSTRVFDVFGKEFSEDNLPSGIVIYIKQYDDGTTTTRKEYRTNL